MKIKKKKKRDIIYDYPLDRIVGMFSNGGTTNPPIFTSNPNDPRIQAYKDSLDLYNQASKIKRTWSNTPQITKEEYERLRLKNKSLPNYEFDEAKYREDKKAGKEIDSFENYIYSAPDSSIFQHPRYIANQEYGVKHRGERDVNKYSDEGVGKFAITLPNGDIKEPMYLYDGKPEWTDYNVFSSDMKTQRMYSQGLDGKPELQNIFSQKIAPIRTDYFGKDSLINSSSINTKSSTTGWYKKGDRPKFKETSNKSFDDYYVPVEAVDVYGKPVQPIVYKPEEEFPWHPLIPKYTYDGKVDPIAPKMADKLQGNNQQLEFNSIPYTKGSYFTRQPQSQELGKKQYYDKSGKLLGEFEEGGNLEDYKVRISKTGRVFKYKTYK